MYGNYANTKITQELLYILQCAGCKNPDVNKCNCKLKSEFKRDNFEDPLIVGATETPKAHIRVQNNGDEPAYNAKLNIYSEVLLEKSDVKGCKSLTRITSQRVRSSHFITGKSMGANNIHIQVNNIN